jgi:hypothetical protein
MNSTTAVEDLLERVRAWCGEHLQVTSVEEAEQFAVAVARQVGQVIVSAGVQQTAGKESYEGCSVPCTCGRRAKFLDYRLRWVATLAGAVPVRRAYYYCRHCHQGQSPWDRRQGLTRRQWTPGTKSLVAHCCGRMPFAEAVELLALTTGLQVEVYSAEQIVAEVGEQLRTMQAEEQAQALAGEAPERPGPPAPRLYVGFDGTSGHIDRAWHEIKTGVIYAGTPDAEGLDEATDCHYLAAQETAELFGARVYAAAARRGVEQAGELVVIGDGAEWIWNLAAHHYPGATQIVDYWHACEHIWELRKVLYAADSEAGDRWAHEHCRRLKEAGPTSLLRALHRLQPTSAEAQEAVRTERGYFARHRRRMQYPEFRARGMMIGSGPVEAACKVVVGHRLKRAGMRWTQAGADAVLAVRCALLNHQPELLETAARLAA